MPPAVRGDKRAFFDIAINDEPVGRIVFELWNFTCPRTVENFRCLSTGEMGRMNGVNATYQGTIFHRVIKGFMIQGGDINHQNGQGGFSIYGRCFDDENLALSHKKPYLLSMANKGPDTNGSQFFITTAATPHLDGKHTVFGEVIKGVDLVKMIENLDTGDEDKPLHKVQIVKCGELVKKSDAAAAAAAAAEADLPSEVIGVKDPMEQPTRNWLMRASKSPEPREGEKKREKRETSWDRRRRQRSNERRRSRSRSRSRGRDRDEDRSGRREHTTKSGIKVRGRGKLTFRGTRDRSTTPPHWKKEESKKLTLDEHKKRQVEQEERAKRIAQREKEDAERRERYQKERIEREAKRELERQERRKREEQRRYASPSQRKTRRDDSEEKVKKEARSPSSSSSSSSSPRSRSRTRSRTGSESD